MRENTADMLKELGLLTSTREKLNLIRHSYKGEDVYLLACGPSLNDYQSETLREYLKDKVVIAAKQSYLRLGPVVDFHILNPASNQYYSYESPPPIRIYHGESEEYEISLPMLPTFTAKDYFKQNIALNHDFGLWTFDATVYRLPACGIVTTIGLYLAYHLGASRIVTIGVDFTFDGYFHDPSKKNYFKKQHLQEIELASRSMPVWRNWLLSQGTELVRLETKTEVNLPGIPVLSLDGVLFHE